MKCDFVSSSENFNPEDELKALAEAETPETSQPAKMLPSQKSDAAPPMTIEPVNHRKPLDTAQLSANELPEREAAPSSPRASRQDRRNRKKNRWD